MRKMSNWAKYMITCCVLAALFMAFSLAENGATAGNNDHEKVTFCHKEPGKPNKTMTLPRVAYERGHTHGGGSNHDDPLGPCPEDVPTKTEPVPGDTPTEPAEPKATPTSKKPGSEPEGATATPTGSSVTQVTETPPPEPQATSTRTVDTKETSVPAVVAGSCSSLWDCICEHLTRIADAMLRVADSSESIVESQATQASAQSTAAAAQATQAAKP